MDEIDCFRQIVDRLVCAIIVVDAAQHVRYRNAAAERMFGYNSAEVVCQSLPTVLPALASAVDMTTESS